MTTDWSADAACRDQPSEVFYGAAGQPFDPAASLDICRRCDAIELCRAYAIAHGDIDADGRAVHGVIAGVAPPAPVVKNGHRYVLRFPRRCALASCGMTFTPRNGQGGTPIYCSPEHAKEGRRISRMESAQRRRTA